LADKSNSRRPNQGTFLCGHFKWPFGRNVGGDLPSPTNEKIMGTLTPSVSLRLAGGLAIVMGVARASTGFIITLSDELWAVLWEL
jgi:hypothetical protein